MWTIALIAGIVLIAVPIITLVIQGHSMYQKATSEGIRRAVGARYGFSTHIAHQTSHDKEPIQVARYQILVIGDSVIEGVGADHVYETLGHQLVREFSKSLAQTGKSNQVEYQLLGRSGYRALDIKQHLIPEISPSFLMTHSHTAETTVPNLKTKLPSLQREFSTCDDQPLYNSLSDLSSLHEDARKSLDRGIKAVNRDNHPVLLTHPQTMVVISCGGNHATHLHSPARYHREMCELIDALRSKLGEDCPVFLIGMPPINIFPWPVLLRTLLGYIVMKYDAVQRTIAETLPAVYHLTALQMFTPTGLLRDNNVMPAAVHDAIDRLFDNDGGSHSNNDCRHHDFDGSVISLPRLRGKRPSDPAALFRMFLGRDSFHPNYEGSSVMAAISLTSLLQWDLECGRCN